MKRKTRDHIVTNALLRIEQVSGIPPAPFEKPNENMDFWVLELSNDRPEQLGKWQSRVSPILLDKKRLLRKWIKAGAKCFLHVDTDSPVPMYPANFECTLLHILAQCGCSLEHGVDD